MLICEFQASLLHRETLSGADVDIHYNIVRNITENNLGVYKLETVNLFMALLC